MDMVRQTAKVENLICVAVHTDYPEAILWHGKTDTTRRVF